MICYNCGSQNDEFDRICVHCGVELSTYNAKNSNFDLKKKLAVSAIACICITAMIIYSIYFK